MPTARPVRSFGATDFIMGSVLAAVVLVSTGCGTVQQADAGTLATVETQSAAPTQSPSASPSTTPSPASTPDDVAPVESDGVPDPGQAELSTHEAPSVGSKALEVLETLAIKGRAPKTGYDRALFGQAWADVDRNGCDTRNDILDRDLTGKSYKPGTRDCLVLAGSLADPYTNTTISFTRGAATSSAVQIDHVVALSDAWQKGAQQLSLEQRTSFANDPLNLLAVDGPANQQKSDSDAASWLPANKGFRCDYVARQISVKAGYGLWVTQAEHDAMARVLGSCTDIDAPTNQMSAAPPVVEAPPAVEQPPAEALILPPPAPIVPVAPVPAPVVEAPAPPAEVPAPAPLVEIPAPAAFYQNCSAVRAAGAAPIRAGDPGFQSKFDGDGDGVGCE